MDDTANFMQNLPAIAKKLDRTLGETRYPTMLRPNPKKIHDMVYAIRALLFPTYFASADERTLPCILEALTTHTWGLARQIHDALPHPCPEDQSACPAFARGLHEATVFMNQLPQIAVWLEEDVEAAYDGDPAASGHDEIILAYPGFFAVLIYRFAHQLCQQKIPLIPRIMTELAHTVTGIDIHPGAEIGRRFFIDHGTGVVIGGTAIIGQNVKIYQGVTLGAFSFPKDDHGNLVRDTKRHPTVGDNVTIYSGATILGGHTTIGHDSVIGGNVWLTQSVPAWSKVTSKPSIEVK